MKPQQLSGPQVTWPTTNLLSKRDALYPLQQECMPTPKNESPVTQHTPSISLNDVPSATPRGGWQKKTSCHLEKKIFPRSTNNLTRNQQFISKANEKCNDPQGAESSDHYKENNSTPDSKLPVSSPKKSCPSHPKKSTGNVDQHPRPHPRHIVRHFSPIPRSTQVFHIAKNGEVKMGLPSNLEKFEGEVIHLLCKLY